MLIFVHVPEFYAAVEQADRPAARGPIIVGGDPTKGGTVTCASAEAREAGVTDGMDLAEARNRCPSAELRATRLRRYREMAAEIRAILRGTSERIEPEGLDGTYLEAPSQEDAMTVAARLCVQLRAELGLAARAGIGSTRFIAHLAGRNAGSAGIKLVAAERSQEFLAPFHVTAIWGLGPSTAERLRELGVETIGELQTRSVAELRPALGPRNAPAFLELARGEDRAPLRPASPVKSVSRETTPRLPSADLRTLGDEIGRLARDVEEMLQRERRRARTITLGVSFVDGERITRAHTVDEALSQPGAIAAIGLELLGRTQAGVRQVRRLRLQVSNLSRAEAESFPQQLRLL